MLDTDDFICVCETDDEEEELTEKWIEKYKKSHHIYL